jgi:hypothetical protein
MDYPFRSLAPCQAGRDGSRQRQQRPAFADFVLAHRYGHAYLSADLLRIPTSLRRDGHLQIPAHCLIPNSPFLVL